MAHKCGKRTGIRQRLGLDAPKEEKTTLDPLAKKLCKSYATGKLSAADVGELSEAAATSSSSSASIIQLAKAAPSTGEKASRNSSRNLRATIDRLSDSQLTGLEPYVCSIPIWDAANQRQVMADSSFLCLHEALDMLVPAGQEEEFTSLDTPDQAGFISDLRHWRARVHSAVSLPFLCLALWGDTAPSSRTDSLCLLTVRLLSGIHKIRLWIWAGSKKQFCNCGCKGRHTTEAVFNVIAWMLRSLAAARFPAVDHLGRPWPKGSQRYQRAGQPMRFGGALLGKTGDWMWLKTSFEFTGLGRVIAKYQDMLFMPCDIGNDIRCQAYGFLEKDTSFYG